MSHGLPYGLMLTRFLMDAGVEVWVEEPSIRQLLPINAVTVQRSFRGVGTCHGHAAQ